MSSSESLAELGCSSGLTAPRGRLRFFLRLRRLDLRLRFNRLRPLAFDRWRPALRARPWLRKRRFLLMTLPTLPRRLRWDAAVLGRDRRRRLPGERPRRPLVAVRTLFTLRVLRALCRLWAPILLRRADMLRFFAAERADATDFGLDVLLRLLRELRLLRPLRLLAVLFRLRVLRLDRVLRLLLTLAPSSRSSPRPGMSTLARRA